MNGRILIRLLAGVAIAVVGLSAQPTVLPAQAQEQGGLITEYQLPAEPEGADGPFGITAGPDGAVWFSHGNNVGRITMGGQVKEYPVPTPDAGVGWMHLGPDRAIWFAERGGNKIGRITVNGRITEYPIPSGSNDPVTCPDETSTVPQGITTGPDGALWFTEQCGNRIGRLTLAGQFTEYPVPTPECLPLGITAGPDGALWFVERLGEKIGRITASGQITEFPISQGTFPQRITVGPDGALWFAELRARKVGRITTGGQYTEYPAPSGPVGMATGPDGAIWYVGAFGNAIGRMTTTGQVTEYPIPTPNSGALQITVGPDAAIWFTETGANQVGRLQIPGVHGRGQIMASSGPGTSATFTVSFTSSAPGQGEVYFGSGPGCSGLVEVATQDLRPNTVSHTVMVTGNDLPGTVGNVGIQPGTTYWYEAVTVTRNGAEIDNNGGKCYSAAVPTT